MRKLSACLFFLSLLIGCAKNQTDTQDQSFDLEPSNDLTSTEEIKDNENRLLESDIKATRLIDVELSTISPTNDLVLTTDLSINSQFNNPPAESLSSPTVYDITNTSILNEAESSDSTVMYKFGRSALVFLNSTSKSLKASNDVAYTEEDKALGSLDVLANDSDSRNEKITVVSYSQSSKRGVVEQVSNGIFRYTPPIDYFGQDQFSYVVSNQSGEQVSATVSIFISNVDDKPVAVADNFQVLQYSSTEFNVLTNDRGIGDNVTLSIVKNVSNGALEYLGGKFKYRPTGDFFGMDNFVYQIADANGDISMTNVNLDVQCVSGCLQRFSVYWDPSPSESVVGYNVYIHDAFGNKLEKVKLGNVTNFEYDAAFKGGYNFSISAYDERNFESDRSEVVYSVF